MQEGVEAEKTAFGDGGGNGGGIKGIYLLRVSPRDGSVLQIPGESAISGKL